MTEQELIQGCIRLDRLYQKLLFDKFSGRFMTLCLRYANDQMEAEDMMQEGFIAIFNNIDKFKNEGVFEGWMSKIVVSACLKVVRKRRVDIVSEDDIHMQIMSNDPYTYDTINENDLLKLINALPTGYKIVFNMSVIEGYSHEEIASLLNIQPATSRSQLVKARKMLQQQIIQLQKIAV
ncbi:MAG: sigma-70 family RNA polymerase sigma factor [Bacteroidetes bacterium]|nr:sigma-70 family RNA polymerase sigma factor [Bacteroidota bacterium]